MQLPLDACLALTVLAVLGGCGGEGTSSSVPLPDNPYVEAAERDVGLALTGDGLLVIAWSAGLTEPIPFGTDIDRALDALVPLRGEPERQVAGCGTNSSVLWPDGLLLWVVDDAVVGWKIDASWPEADRVATLDGFGVGSTRAELAMLADVEGISFSIEGISGRLDGNGPTARVQELRAGERCASGAS